MAACLDGSLGQSAYRCACFCGVVSAQTEKVIEFFIEGAAGPPQLAVREVKSPKQPGSKFVVW
jgi:hypothetical protein